MGHIFISYSHKDEAYVRKLYAALQQRGLDTWIDNRIDYGTLWPVEIQQRLDSCSIFILVMTPAAYESRWVQSELNRAQRKNKPVFPLLLEGDESWLSIESTQYVDVRGGTLPPENFFRSLASALPPREQPVQPESAPSAASLRPVRKWGGVIAAAAGFGIWLLAFGIIRALGVQIVMLWPLHFIVFGSALFLIGKSLHMPGFSIPAAVIAGLGCILFYQDISGNWSTWSFAWTLVPGFVGAGMLLSRFAGSRKASNTRYGWILVVASLVLCVIMILVLSSMASNR